MSSHACVDLNQNVDGIGNVMRVTAHNCSRTQKAVNFFDDFRSLAPSEMVKLLVEAVPTAMNESRTNFFFRACINGACTE